MKKLKTSRLRGRIAKCVAAALLCLTAASCLPSSGAVSLASSGAVPGAYKNLYSELDKALDRLKTAPASDFMPLVSSNLLNANSNMLPDIADSSQNRTTVAKTLDRFKEMGLQVVDITIQYPVLVQAFPRSGDYLKYYQKVFGEAKSRGLQIAVEVGSTFTSPMFARLPVSDWYKGLTQERFMVEKRQMIETILHELGPDYLTFEEEPTTQHANLGLSYTPSDVQRYMAYFLDGLDTGGVPVGAGAGLWDEDAYWQVYLDNPAIDFINFHIYPIYDTALKAKLEGLSRRASERGKAVVVGEAWLYKTDGRERLGGPVAAGEEIFARDSYAFWAPLDCKFFGMILDMASAYHWHYVNFFWSRYFFSYIGYSSATENPRDAWAANQKNATANVYKAGLTAAGQYLKDRLTP